MSDFKQRLARGDVLLGSWITLAHPAIAEIMAKSGFEWLVVDLEHSVITIREAEELIRIIDLCGIAPFVRLTSNDPNQIKRVLDAGAKGIIVPLVNSVADAQAAVRGAYYPPKGNRGVGLARAQSYGNSFKEYFSWIKDKGIVVVAMIEHIDSVKNMESILAVDGIDGYFIGPYDLSASMGKAGQFEDAEFKKILAQIKTCADRSDKVGGIHVVEPDEGRLSNALEAGHTFIACSLDSLILDRTCRSIFQNASKFSQGKDRKGSPIDKKL